MLKVEILGQIEAAGTPDGAYGMLAARSLPHPRNQAYLVIHPDHGASAVECLQHHVPVAFAFLQIGLKMGEIGTGTLGRPCGLHLGPGTRRLVVKCHRPHGDDERTGHREGQLIGIADQVIHAGQPEVSRILAHRKQLQDGLIPAGLAKADVAITHSRSDFQIGNLLAQRLIGIPVDRRHCSPGKQP